MHETALERLLRYVRIDTQSKDDSDAYPSTEKQLVLLELLRDELEELGVRQARMDAHGYVFATVPSNLPAGDPASCKVPSIGFIAHVDTSPSFSGAGVKPQVIENYGGGDIILPGNPEVVIRVPDNPELLDNIGKSIVTADGTTLLGADDKAGIAIIMTAAQTLLGDPSLPHGEVKIAFTPDEEVGGGTKFFDIGQFGAAFAYTVDGETAGELNKETFSANQAVITVHGRNIHPGKAKGIMVNSLRAMGDIIVRMPRDVAPESTADYEPYIHPYAVRGEEANCTLKILLRDFSTPGLEILRQKLERVLAEVRPLHPEARIELNVVEQYRNMKDSMGADTRVLDYLWEAACRAGLEPRWVPVRGGTDGSRLTESGLPTPNIFTGGRNFHGPTEWLSVDGMNKSVETVLQLARIWVEKSR